MSESNEGAQDTSVSPETQAILDELRKEGHTLEGDTAEVEVPEPSQPEPEQTEVPVDRAPKEPAMIPAWEHKVAEKRWEKEREQLQSDLEALRANPTQANQEAVSNAALNLKELAEQNGLVLDPAQERFFSALLQNVVPQDVTKKLEALEADRQRAFLETQYEQEFSRDVEPLLRERYGDVPASKLAELKAKLHDTAFTETYAKVPLRKVFLAEESEFKLERNEPHHTVQAVKSGKTRATQVDYDKVDEDTFRRMTPDEIEKYTEWQIERSGGRRWR